MITIHDPEKFGELISPTFRIVEGAYFLECESYGERVTPEYIRKIAGSEFGVQNNEFSVNHVHIFDLISHDAPVHENERCETWDTNHPDFVFAWMLAKQFARAWQMKLSVEFPNEKFVIFASKLIDPIVRFYRKPETDMLGDLPEDVSQRIEAGEIYILFT